MDLELVPVLSVWSSLQDEQATARDGFSVSLIICLKVKVAAIAC